MSEKPQEGVEVQKTPLQEYRRIATSLAERLGVDIDTLDLTDRNNRLEANVGQGSYDKVERVTPASGREIVEEALKTVLANVKQPNEKIVVAELAVQLKREGLVPKTELLKQIAPDDEAGLEELKAEAQASGSVVVAAKQRLLLRQTGWDGKVVEGTETIAADDVVGYVLLPEELAAVEQDGVLVADAVGIDVVDSSYVDQTQDRSDRSDQYQLRYEVVK